MSEEPTTVEQALDAASEAFDQGDLAGAAELALQALDALRDERDDEAAELRLEAELVVATVEVEARDDASALARLERLEALHPADADVRLLGSRLRLFQWDLDAAEAQLEGIDVPDDRVAEVAYHRAILADVRGDHAAADDLYEQAAARDVENCPLPVRLGDDEALELLRGIIEAFPQDVRAALDNVRIELPDMPDQAIDGGPDTDPLLLGLYHGQPVGEGSDAPVELPGSVRVFKRNLERIAADRAELVEQLRITLLHEIGHHLGWDEDDLETRGLA